MTKQYTLSITFIIGGETETEIEERFDDVLANLNHEAEMLCIGGFELKDEIVEH